tara:strand:- start:45276 stop:46271 length:996 start_codon:yes stop_codon:yes gene_type:complete
MNKALTKRARMRAVVRARNKIARTIPTPRTTQATRRGNKKRPNLQNIRPTGTALAKKIIDSQPPPADTAVPHIKGKLRLISVLIAAHCPSNPAWVRQAINSILSQELPDSWELEILIGVDACQNTLKIAKSISDSRVKVLMMKHNYGPYVVFNTLMDYAQGSLISRFDADDIMMPRYIQQHIDLLLKNSKCIAVSSCDVVNKKLKSTGERVLAVGQCTFHRDLWYALGGFRRWRCAADREFLIRATALGYSRARTNTKGVLRRKHANNLTSGSKTGMESALRKHYHSKRNRVKANCAKGLPVPKLTPIRGIVDLEMSDDIFNEFNLNSRSV